MGDARDEGGAQESVLLPVAQGAATNPRTTPHASVEMIRSSRRMRAAGSRLLGEGTAVAGGRVWVGWGDQCPVWCKRGICPFGSRGAFSGQQGGEEAEQDGWGRNWCVFMETLMRRLESVAGWNLTHRTVIWENTKP